MGGNLPRVSFSAVDENVDVITSISAGICSPLRSGVVCLASTTNAYGHKYVSESYNNCREFGIDAKHTPDAECIKATVPSNIPTGSFGGREGYSNPIGGWAEAGRALMTGLNKVQKLGGKVRAGAEVEALVREGKKVTGVKLKGGEVVKADLVLVSD